MPRYRLLIEYDGTKFCGWQSQKEGRSVQDELSRALHLYCAARAVIYGAGRTDSGVHALAQCAHFDLDQEKEPYELRAAMNFHLRGKKIAILAAEKISSDFHARFSAEKRHYIYVIANRTAPPILMADRAWHIPHRLDDDAMTKAARCLIGRHDFTTFRAAACQAASPIKTLDALSMTRYDEIIVIRARAKSFLQHQVRSFVGALAFVGLGKMSSDDMDRILKARARALCPPLAPPSGLYLAQIDYPPPCALQPREINPMPDFFLR